MNKPVSITRCASYNPDKVYLSLKQAIDLLGGIASFIKLGQKVLLKPNFLLPSKPEKAELTHPAIIRAVIRLVKGAGAIPYIGDSPGIGSADFVARVSGVKKVAEEEKVDILPFKESIVVDFPSGKAAKKLTIARDITEMDFIINLPKFKPHVLTGMSLAVKNIFGVVPGLKKSHYHLEKKGLANFCNMILDLYAYVQPGLNIIDAIVAMEDFGPRGGPPKQMGLIIASSDALSADIVATAIANIDFLKVPLLVEAKNQGMTDLDINKIKILGEMLEAVKVRDFKYTVPSAPDFFVPGPVPGFLMKFLKINLGARPEVSPEKCTKCGDCEKICAAKAIDSSKNGKPEFDYIKCIRCYCCAEICPVSAIELKKNLLTRIFSRVFKI